MWYKVVGNTPEKLTNNYEDFRRKFGVAESE